MPAFGDPRLIRAPAGVAAGKDLSARLPRAVLYPTATASLLAALVHLWAAPGHLSEWWGYGALFLAAALVQGVYAAVLLRWPSWGLLLAGILGNSSTVLLYLATRTSGVGPEAGEVGAIGVIDACATASGLFLVGALGALLLRRLLRERLGLALIVAATTLLLLAHLPHVILLFGLI